MEITSLIQLVGAVGKEKFVIQSIVLKFGINSLFMNLDSIEISNKTKNAIKQLDSILNNHGDLITNISGLTEIPKKTIYQCQSSGLNIQELLKHPEKIDVDARQFDKLRCLHYVENSYQVDKEKEALEKGYIREMNDYEPER